MAVVSRKVRRDRRHTRVRKKIEGRTDRPRLAVFRSNKHIGAQIIDDSSAVTICATTSYSPDLKGKVKGYDIAGAEAVGKAIAEKAKSKGIELVVFDCGGNKYHGRVKALADAARKAGLNF
jgi:large subunit ribosomal protein L18